MNTEHNDQAAAKQGFTIHNIYTKDVSFEAPNTPHIFSLPWEPNVDFDLAINSQNLEGDVWECVLDVTVKVSVKLAEEQQKVDKKEFENAFIVEVKLAGIFSLLGLDKAQIDKVLATTIPTILFPYVREAISSLVAKGGFPQLLLPPMNFDAMYQKHLEENTSSAANATIN